jgi:hypothetical protein
MPPTEPHGLHIASRPGCRSVKGTILNSALDDQHNALLGKYTTVEDEFEDELRETNEELKRSRDTLEVAQSHQSSTS